MSITSLSFTFVNTYAPQAAKSTAPAERQAPAQTEAKHCDEQRPATRQNRLVEAMMSALRELGFGSTPPAAPATAPAATDAPSAATTAQAARPKPSPPTIRPPRRPPWPTPPSPPTSPLRRPRPKLPPRAQPLPWNRPCTSLRMSCSERCVPSAAASRRSKAPIASMATVATANTMVATTAGAVRATATWPSDWTRCRRLSQRLLPWRQAAARSPTHLSLRRSRSR